MLAHVQHHYWKTDDGSACPQIEFAAMATDEILGKLATRCKGLVGDGRVAVMNALSQSCAIEESPWILYRPTNHAALSSFLGVKSTRVEPLMTYDAHVFFATADDARAGVGILESAKIDGKRLFHVEPDEHDPLKVFYRVEMHDPVQPDAEFIFRNETARFDDHFTTIVQRTGKHQQRADLQILKSAETIFQTTNYRTCLSDRRPKEWRRNGQLALSNLRKISSSCSRSR